MLHYAVESALDDLLCCWRAHQSVVSQPETTIRQRGETRTALDHARDRMHRLRVALYPDADERAAMVNTVWCETLDMAVHLRWTDGDPARPGHFLCPCGLLVAIDQPVDGASERAY